MSAAARPTPAQRKIMELLRSRGAQILVWNGSLPCAYIRNGEEGDITVRLPTLKAMERAGWLKRHAWEGPLQQSSSLTTEGRRALAAFGGEGS